MRVLCLCYAVIMGMDTICKRHEIIMMTCRRIDEKYGMFIKNSFGWEESANAYYQSIKELGWTWEEAETLPIKQKSLTLEILRVKIGIRIYFVNILW